MFSADGGSNSLLFHTRCPTQLFDPILWGLFDKLHRSCDCSGFCQLGFGHGVEGLPYTISNFPVFRGFVSLLKTKRTMRKTDQTRTQAKTYVFGYNERFDKFTHRHSTRIYLRDMEFEQRASKFKCGFTELTIGRKA